MDAIFSPKKCLFILDTSQARFTYVDELGQPKRGSVYAKAQRECRQKLTATLKDIDAGTYRKTQRYTVEEWFNEWLNVYCTTLRDRTVIDYSKKAERHILPNIGKTQLSALTPVQVQRLINRMCEPNSEGKTLAPKSVKNIHGILHSCLKQAVIAGIITTNPADNTKLPKGQKPDLAPMMDDAVSLFLNEIKGDPFERIFIVDLFTGMRQSEILGLSWDDVDLTTQEIRVCRQLQKNREAGYSFIDTTKNGKARVIPIAPAVVKVLREQRRQQAEWQLAAGEVWSNDHNLVFTDEIGGHVKHKTVYLHFKKHVKAIGMESTRFHDLRHSHAIMSLQAGCSVKAVQEQLGHYSSAFTMDVYAAVSETMKQDTRNRVESLIKQVSDL